MADKEEKKVVHTKADKVTIKSLEEAGVELKGDETSEELETLAAAQSMKGDDEAGVQEEVEGVPNQLPPRTEPRSLAGKTVNFPVHFVAAVKGGFALYNETGKRISPAYAPDQPLDESPNATKGVLYINKACAKFNAMRWKNTLPGDLNR